MSSVYQCRNAAVTSKRLWTPILHASLGPDPAQNSPLSSRPLHDAWDKGSQQFNKS